MSQSYSWTQPICDDCWDGRNQDRPSPRRGGGEFEVCVHCAKSTSSGIYVRVDPATAYNPTLERLLGIQEEPIDFDALGPALLAVPEEPDDDYPA